jgi:glycerophosphoryl diester phosphodiesterase
LSHDPRNYGDLVTPRGLLLPPTTLVRDAHEAGLFVHPYTFRRETEYLAGEYEGDPVREYLQFFDLGVDGVFTDNADLAFKARKTWLSRSR